MTEKQNAEIATLSLDDRRELFTAGSNATLGFTTLQCAMNLVDSPSGTSSTDLYAEIKESVRCIFASDEEEGVEARDPVDLLKTSNLSDKAVLHFGVAIHLLENAADFMHEWNSSHELAGKTALVHANSFYRRTLTSTRLERVEDSRRKRLLLPDIRLAVVLTSEPNRPLELVIASNPDSIAQVKTDPETNLPGVHRVFRSHDMAGLALSALDSLDDNRFQPDFTIVNRSWLDGNN